MIRIVNLTKCFGKHKALDNLNLEIPAGEIFAFIGPNGAGKTTTVKLLSGLLKPTSGSVSICGYDVQKEHIKVKKIIGLLPDRPFIYSKLTGIEFLQIIGDIYGIPGNEQKSRIPELITMFGMDEFINELIESYSHGMRQRLILASILLRQPKVLILDEPLVGLDPKMARLVKDMFIELSNRGITIFMCTHILELAEKLSHRIGIIDNGRLIALGSKEELIEKLKGTASLEDIYLKLTNASQMGTEETNTNGDGGN
ncbi:MAG: hypothetical protein AUJ85_04060 [Elusimicrobia bacterium CG1_02_37_114]|nr:MAG: hypothetical protein AUJ85_04060 [Elusimicrobia bacterium CG1_02_37_114]PIV54154.1 MAG: hypothetical protein COS17_00095 [Elusimicrobia bacterium CG02_land_8_20_14_3_00_37_13]